MVPPSSLETPFLLGSQLLAPKVRPSRDGRHTEGPSGPRMDWVPGQDRGPIIILDFHPDMKLDVSV